MPEEAEEIELTLVGETREELLEEMELSEEDDASVKEEEIGLF